MINLGEVTDREVLDIMKDGGKKLCKYALDQWIGNVYRLDEESRQAHIKRWHEIESRITDLAYKIKEAGLV